MRFSVFLYLMLLFFFNRGSLCFAQQTLFSKKVDKAPIIDGVVDDIWKDAESIVTPDKVAGIDITLKSVYTDAQIFFLVSYPDPDESRSHKTWVWNSETEIYDRGTDREDMFVFKWAMEKSVKDLSVFADTEYTADIWFWKAVRTDPRGYADDKIQHLTQNYTPKTKPLQSVSGKTMYLQRRGDEGQPTYVDTLYVEYQGDKLSHYTYQEPSGSRADIKAKGEWFDGRWTIEFSRALDTGHDDDVLLTLGGRYFFGVSRYEMSGRDPEPLLDQPLYGSGDVTETLFLEFR